MLAYWFNLMSSNQSLVFTILTGVPPDKRSPHGDYKRLAQRKRFISEVMTRKTVFYQRHNAFIVGFQGQQWSKVATFDMTQSTASFIEILS